MMCARLLGLLAGALVAAVGLEAHEGHPRQVMGTVSALRPGGHLEVRTADGRSVTVMLGRETRILKGSSPGVVEDLAPGARVVVSFAEEGDMKMATEVRLAGRSRESGPAPEGSAPLGPRDDRDRAPGERREDELRGDRYHDPDVWLYQ